MKKYLIIIALFISCKCLGQKDTSKHKVYYGIAGIQFDSTKYYFHKFLYFQDKMQKAKPGKYFDRMEDSCKRYLDLLNRNKS